MLLRMKRGTESGPKSFADKFRYRLPQKRRPNVFYMAGLKSREKSFILKFVKLRKTNVLIQEKAFQQNKKRKIPQSAARLS